MARQPDPPSPAIMVKPPVQIGLIQGSTPGSINEWWVAQALDHEMLYYFYQFIINGGTSLRGGQVIDFLVHCGGWVPVFVNGAYWHDIKNDPEMPLKLAAAQARFKMTPVVLLEEETKSYDLALAAVRKKIE